MSNLAHSTKNDHRYGDLMKEVRKLGGDSADGADALPKLAAHVVKAAADGVIGLDKDVDGADDAGRIYQNYAEAESKKAIHNHSKNGVKANTSKLRKLIEFGCLPNVDAIDVLDRAMKLRQEMAAVERKVKSAYPAYVDVARKQIAEPDNALTDEEIKATVLKQDNSEEVTVDKVLSKIETMLDKLISGEAGCEADQSDETISALDSVKKRRAALALMSKQDELRALAESMGFQIAPAEAAE